MVRAFKDPVFLHQKYIVEGLSCDEIGAEIFSSASTVHKHLRRFKIPLRGSDLKNRSRLAYGEGWRQGKVVPNEAEVANVEKMRDLRAKGFSYWKIADILNSMDVPTKTRKGKWHPRFVKKLLDT